MLKYHQSNALALFPLDLPVERKCPNVILLFGLILSSVLPFSLCFSLCFLKKKLISLIPSQLLSILLNLSLQSKSRASSIQLTLHPSPPLPLSICMSFPKPLSLFFQSHSCIHFYAFIFCASSFPHLSPHIVHPPVHSPSRHPFVSLCLCPSTALAGASRRSRGDVLLQVCCIQHSP